ncbi:MAG TPA: serine/threonine phosphatase [Oscillatoriales cyanobacterium M4454_W2019_049]|nr:serine/threonine phosphatase [Oscillatoriales cyanobacterium M4454_W2019_049]
MLSCPECGSKNPDTHKFCRQCGVALTHKVCGECGAEVVFDRPECDRCGADVRTLLRAIVYPKAEAIAKWQQGTPLALDDLRAKSLPERQRYRVVSPLRADLTEDCPEIELKVWDAQPFDIPEARTDVPPLAQSYVALQSNWTSNAPPLHDCWQTDDETVILLKDRSTLPLLVDRWGDNSVSWLQKLAWLEDMLDLWLALAELDCRASLLDLSNLRIDDKGKMLCLQRLYRDPDTDPATLRDLGRVWELFYQESGQTLIGSMIALLKNLESGQIETIDRARLALQRIAAEEEEEITEWSSSTPEDDPTVIFSQLLALEVAGQTDIGQQRSHNEDTFSTRTQIETMETPSDRALSAKGIYILCDGMGGHDGGEIASSLAVKTIEDYFKTHGLDELPGATSIREALQRANDAIYELNQQENRKGSRRMGTTLVMVLVCDTQVAIAHVGDSRCYSFSAKKGLQQLTTDHAVATRAILQGVDPAIAYSWINAYQLTQALGPRESEALEADVQFLELEEDTLFVLGSDGLTDDDLLEMHCIEYLQPLLDRDSDLKLGARRLIDLANRENGHDNITTILVRAIVQDK